MSKLRSDGRRTGRGGAGQIRTTAQLLAAVLLAGLAGGTGKLNAQAVPAAAASASPDAAAKPATVSETATPSPATVVLQDGALTVRSNGTDLAQILRQLSQVSGMQVTGALRSLQVYGTYGPRTPRQVLAELLAGTGYNFMMVGGTSGSTPRELLLTLKSGGPTAPGRPGSSGFGQSGATTASANATSPAVDAEPPGPGAIVDVPPEPPEDLEERSQQNMKRLRAIQKAQSGQGAPQ